MGVLLTLTGQDKRKGTEYFYTLGKKRGRITLDKPPISGDIVKLGGKVLRVVSILPWGTCNDSAMLMLENL